MRSSSSTTPFVSAGRWSKGHTASEDDRKRSSSADEGVFVTFDIKRGESVQARVGTSFVSVEEAERNLRAEIPDWNFQRVEKASEQAWAKVLGQVDIVGSDVERRILYTALYHTAQVPRICNDVSGTYPRFSGNGEIEHTNGHDYYDDFSLWDTFRALHPLLTILDPRREVDMVQSLVLKGQQGGYLPMFPAWGSYTQEMTGDHAVAVIGDAYAKGLRGFDVDAAYRLMRKSAMTLPLDQQDYIDGQGRRGLASYLQHGFIPLEDKVPYAFHQNGQVSRTLEYAYDDFVLSKFAKATGHTEDAALFPAAQPELPQRDRFGERLCSRTSRQWTLVRAVQSAEELRLSGGGDLSAVYVLRATGYRRPHAAHRRPGHLQTTT